MDFNFDKPFYPERELLKIIPIKRSTFYAWQSEWIAQGNDPKLMGKVTILNSTKSKRAIVYWNAKIFLEWLFTYKANQDPKYNHQQHEKNIAIAVLKGVKTNGIK
jgi:hypothetical protein|tara:strand:- start:1095 stop:1409 length:315 start_codon:yes stop_codon:yes gene_type:complete